MTDPVPLHPVAELRPDHKWCAACFGNGWYQYTEFRPVYSYVSPIPVYVQVPVQAACAECRGTGQVVKEDPSLWP